MIIVLWLAFAAAMGYWAAKKGRSGFGFFVLALVISPILAALIVWTLEPRKTNALASMGQPAARGPDPLAAMTRLPSGPALPDLPRWRVVAGPASPAKPASPTKPRRLGPAGLLAVLASLGAAAAIGWTAYQLPARGP